MPPTGLRPDATTARSRKSPSCELRTSCSNRACAGAGRGVRVDVEKLEALVNLVGELVTSSARVSEQARTLKDGSLLEAASGMHHLVEGLREVALGLRMVPVITSCLRPSGSARFMS